MEIVQENVYATIDRVVPSISQLLVTLEKVLFLYLKKHQFFKTILNHKL